MKRPSESVVTFLGLVWFMVVALWLPNLGETQTAAVSAVLGGSGFLWSYLVDRQSS